MQLISKPKQNMGEFAWMAPLTTDEMAAAMQRQLFPTYERLFLVKYNWSYYGRCLSPFLKRQSTVHYCQPLSVSIIIGHYPITTISHCQTLPTILHHNDSLGEFHAQSHGFRSFLLCRQGFATGVREEVMTWEALGIHQIALIVNDAVGS